MAEARVNPRTLSWWKSKLGQVAAPASFVSHPLSGALYLSTNRRRTTAKVLRFDGTGLSLYIKRLAQGQFMELWNGDDATMLSLSRPELELFLRSYRVVSSSARRRSHDSRCAKKILPSARERIIDERVISLSEIDDPELLRKHEQVLVGFKSICRSATR